MSISILVISLLITSKIKSELRATLEAKRLLSLAFISSIPGVSINSIDLIF